MIFVLFEVKVKEEGVKEYLALAAGLKEELERSEGFIRSERYKSLVNEGKILSLSVWESEKAVEKWRNTMNHRVSQRQGHDSLFESYTLTVASKIRSYTLTDRVEAPEDSEQFFANSAE
jgi:heme-degrading monooxygenase HmoA